MAPLHLAAGQPGARARAAAHARPAPERLRRAPRPASYAHHYIYIYYCLFIIIYFAASGVAIAVEVLLQCGAHPSATAGASARAPLHFAAAAGHAVTAAVLLRSGICEVRWAPAPRAAHSRA